MIIKGKLNYNHLFLHLFFLSFPLLIFVWMLYYIIVNSIPKQDIVVYYMVGSWVVGVVFFTARFFKLIYINDDRLTIYYPFLLRRKIIKISEIIGSSIFDAGFYQNPITRNSIDHSFTYYKTKSGRGFLISDFNFINYKEIVTYIEKNTEIKEDVHFLNKNHAIIFVVVFFALIISLAFFAG